MQNVGGTMRSLFDAANGTRTEAKTQALAWLRNQLEWERTLESLRDDEQADRKAA